MVGEMQQDRPWEMHMFDGASPIPETGEPISTQPRGFLTRILLLRENEPHRHDTDHQDTLSRELFTYSF